VGLDEVGLLVGLSLLLGLAKLLDKTHGAALQAAVDPAAGTSVDNIAELVGGEVEEPIGREVTSAWGLFAMAAILAISSSIIEAHCSWW
jgi:hypothetical protein